MRPATLCLVVLAYSTLGCAAVVDKMRPDFVEATTEDAAILTIAQAPRYDNFVSAVPDPVKCEGAMDLGGSIQLEGERRVRLPPEKEFAFAVALVQDTGFQKFSCEQMVVFTPAARAEYRAVVHGTPRRCGIELKKVVAGVEVEETGARRRMVSPYGKCADP